MVSLATFVFFCLLCLAIGVAIGLYVAYFLESEISE